MMKLARTLAVSPRLELFFALAAVLSENAADGQSDGVRRWLGQARRKADQGFRRRLSDQARAPAFWQHLAALPLAGETAHSTDVDGVIEALAALPPERFQPASDPEMLQLLVVDALRRFDRVAFAAYWRRWREELTADEHRLKARLDDFPIDAQAATVIFLPSRFAPSGLIQAGETVLVPFDPDRLPLSSVAPVALPRRAASTSPDPALIFRALGDATRYTIAGLIAREPMTSAELARRLDISKPTMAHHLRALRAASLVHENVRGTRIVLTLDRAVLEGLSDAAVAQLFGAVANAPIRRSRRA
jgi:DNA-binding transcriptional ArsR family regulator